ncbi:MAG: dihydroxyacetone kinase subunit DhaL [Planctomycetota bacterium]|nr:dihydroxyacetone kinase subunit DhaL [Planctomycetota bacterium]
MGANDNCVDAARLVRMFRAAAAQIRANAEALGKYDSVGGDGDHGTTMVRAMGNMEKAIGASPVADLKTLLNNIAWAVMGTDGGATGPLFGSFFMGMAPAAAGRKTLDAKTLASMLEGGLASIQKNSKAKQGDKTMLDALIPAVQSLRQAADGGAAPVACLRKAAEAAAQGAEATKNMVARFGRARNIGEKSLGSPDPGAVSVSLVLKGFVEGAEANA